MNARYYLPGIGRFASPDTIVPDPADPQSFNRYSYGLNNPVKYVDPTGHCAGSPVSGSGDPWGASSSNENTQCWRIVWEIYGEWNRNSLWESMFGSLEKFWELAHLDILDYEYWSTHYKTHGGPDNYDNPLGYHALADYRGIAYKNPMRSNAYCYHPGCQKGEWIIEAGIGPLSYNSQGELEVGAGTIQCVLAACGGIEGSVIFTQDDVGFEQTLYGGVGIGHQVEFNGVKHGLLLTAGFSLQTDYSRTGRQQSVGFTTIGSIGPLNAKIEYR